MKKFRDLIGEASEQKEASASENVEGLNGTNVGYLITYALWVVAQSHIWHLLCQDGQKHSALGEFYEELQGEADSLAESFIGHGGVLKELESERKLEVAYSEELVISGLKEFRVLTSNCITETNNPEMMSIMDGIVDLQELIDTKLFKFKLN